MRLRVARCVLLLLASCSSAAGQSASSPGPPEAAPTPVALSLVFDDTAAALPQLDIRAAVERAVGVPVVLGPDPERPTLRVSVAPDGELVLSFQRSSAALERRLPNPRVAEQIPLLVGLAAANLVRNQTGDLSPMPEPPSAAAASSKPPSSASAARPAPPEGRLAPMPKAWDAAPGGHLAAMPEAWTAKQRSRGAARNWFGIHVGIDLAPISAGGACTAVAREYDHMTCFFQNGSMYSGQPALHSAGSVAAGLAAATVPLLLSYEHLFGSFGVEARAGYAFNGGPTPQSGSAFLPARVELRGKFWPLGTIPPKRAFRPYAHLGAGIAQVDVKVHDVSIVDCTSIQSDKRTDCLSAPDARAASILGDNLDVTVVKSLGMLYVTGGGGLAYAVADGHALVLNLNLMLLFPAVGFALEPSIGYQIGI